jgi:hypothetical protein
MFIGLSRLNYKMLRIFMIPVAADLRKPFIP